MAWDETLSPPHAAMAKMINTEFHPVAKAKLELRVDIKTVQDHDALVLYDDDKMVTVLVMAETSDRNKNPLIKVLVTDENYRNGEGWGYTAMREHAKMVMDANGPKTIFVEAENAACGFYEKCGMKKAEADFD